MIDFPEKFQVWKRLSSLQRSVICFVLLLGGISALYLVTSVRQLHGGRWGHAGPSDLRDFLDSDERQKMEREKREYIQQVKQKLAKQQVGDIVVRI